jgi:hypothetical protein
MWEGLCAEGGVFSGCFLEDWQDTETDLNISPLLRGLSAKSPFFFLAFSRQGTGAPPAASGRRWRQRPGTRGDRVSGENREETTGIPGACSPWTGFIRRMACGGEHGNRRRSKVAAVFQRPAVDGKGRSLSNSASWGYWWRRLAPVGLHACWSRTAAGGGVAPWPAAARAGRGTTG